jgi:hypothetical protein
VRGDESNLFDAKENAMMRIGRFYLALFLFTNLMQLGQAAQEPVSEHYVGVAYTRTGGKMLYSEEHWIMLGPGSGRRVVLYRCPDGQPFARKQLYGQTDDATPDFDLYDRRDGYREGVEGRGGERQVYVQRNQAAPRRSARLATPQNAVIDAGFDAYLRSHWDALGKGEGTNIAFLLPSRLAYINLKIQVHDRIIKNSPLREFSLSLNAWYGFVVPSIDVTYSMLDRRLLSFAGVSNVRDNRGDTQQVRIVFLPDKRYPPPSQQQIRHAETEPLVSHCSMEN